MSGIKHIKRLPAMLAAWLLFATHGSGGTISRLSTRFLTRGEKALLEIAVSGIQPTEFPKIPAVPGVDISQAGSGGRIKQLRGGGQEFVFEYILSSYETGTHVLPGVEVVSNGIKSRTEPLEFTVFNPDDLQWSEAVAGTIRFRYASAFRIMNPHPYHGETTPVEIKIFVPRDLFVEDWGVPSFERDGVTSWRFQPSSLRGQVNLLGLPYVSVSYPSTLTPTRTGRIGIGPASIRLVTTRVSMDGILSRVSEEANLRVPKLEIDAIPLPGIAPEGFENAVGSFQIKTSTTLTKSQEGEPIPVDIEVSGSGNLDTLRPPKPIDITGWKVYETTTDQRGDERTELSGTTVFHQFMRPLELKPAVPAFRLVYFDPKEKSYKTLTTSQIPLQMRPAMVPKPDTMGPPQTPAVPVERMTDILGILHPANLTLTGSKGLPGWPGHLIAGLIALALIAKALWTRNAHRFHQNPAREARIAALREIERIQAADAAGFLMAAGRFIEHWHGDNPSPELLAVLTERDTTCFRQDQADIPKLEPARRNAILRILRHASMVWIIAAVLAIGAGQARAQNLATQAQQAYDAAKYDEAITLWLNAGRYEELSPDTLYNIGNACYRAGSPGHAALYYRRALTRAPNHQESRQNLRFIERKYGAITVHRPEYEYAIARFPLSTWQALLWTGAWLCLLAALVFPATRPGAGIRLIAVAAWVIGPLLAAVGGLGWRYFPNDAAFAPIARQAVIIREKTILHTDAARTSPQVIDAPPGSLCEVIRESGRWAYVAFATKTRGWIPMESIEKIIPTSPPAPPKIRKPTADGKSA